jgi:MFS family permease
MPTAVWRLTIAYSLMMAGTSLLVLLAGIIGTDFAPSPDLATLPIALAVVGVASSTLPTGRLLGRYGRRPVFVAYGAVAIGSALLAMYSLQAGSFGLFCASGFLMGWAAAASHQYRFAALEAVPAELAPKATSILLLGGILSAFIGPEIAVRGRDLLATEYAGSFLLLTLSYAAGIVLVAFHRDHALHCIADHGAGRPLLEIFRSPVVVVAVAAAAVGYGVMSLLMTATPISMHGHGGHSLDATKWVIQSHIAAMYLPSLLYAALFARLGFRGMLGLGLAVYLLCLGIAAFDTAFLNYWLALVLLGIGWNFLFLSGTNLLPYGYHAADRFRVQSANDFLVFSVQALASLGSGWLLFHWQWRGVLLACLPLLLGFAYLLLAQRQLLNRLKGTVGGIADAIE